jgi:antitoxin VapB
MIEAKVVKSGKCQAIELPQDYHINSKSVKLNKIGNLLVIVPENDPWAIFQEGIAEAEDFPARDNSELELRNVAIH